MDYIIKAIIKILALWNISHSPLNLIFSHKNVYTFFGVQYAVYHIFAFSFFVKRTFFLDLKKNSQKKS